MEHQRWMERAIRLARLSPRSASAFAVGAVLVSATGDEIATGYSRDTDP